MKKYLLFVFLFLTPITVFPQVAATSELFQTLKAKDDLLFNVGFNACDIKQFENLVSENFEFYHDQAGITDSKSAFIAGIKNGLCKLNYKARRELVAASLEIYALNNKGVLYGAIQSGQHRFYAIEPGKPERLTSTARFVHVWLLENGEWKFSRGLSFDHREPRFADSINNESLFKDKAKTEK